MTEQEPEVSSMIKKTEEDILNILLKEKEDNTKRFRSILNLSTGFACLLFISLTITCLASRDLDPVSVVIGYWLVLFLLGGRYVINKTRKTSGLRSEYCCTDEDVRNFIMSLLRMCRINLVKFNANQGIFEALRQRRFYFFGLVITFLGCMFTSGVVMMKIHTTPSDLRWFPLKLSYSIWIIIQGLIIASSSRWCGKRKMIIFMIASCAACVTVNILCLYYGAIDMDFIPLLKAIFGFRRSFGPDLWHQSSNDFDSLLRDIKYNWPKNDEHKLVYPNWTFIISLVLEKGSIIPLSSMLVVTATCYVLSLFKTTGQGISELRIVSDKEKSWKGKMYKWILRIIGVIFIFSALFIVFSGAIMDCIAPLFFKLYWLKQRYDTLGYVMCGILIVTGIPTFMYANKSRSALCAVIQILVMLSVFGLCIYFVSGYLYIRYTNNSDQYAIPTWNKIDEVICPKRYENINNTTDIDDNNTKCIFLCGKSYDKVQYGQRSTYSKYTVNCEPYCFNQEVFCNGVFDFPINKTKYPNSGICVSYCNETGKTGYGYDNNWYCEHGNELLMLADEISCNPYPQYFEASLVTNIAILCVIGILSLLACIVLWKSAKMSKIIYQSCIRYGGLTLSDDKGINETGSSPQTVTT